MVISVENCKIVPQAGTTVFCACAEGIPLELCIGAGGKKNRVMRLPGRIRSLTISSALWIQSTNVTYRYC